MQDLRDTLAKYSSDLGEYHSHDVSGQPRGHNIFSRFQSLVTENAMLRVAIEREAAATAEQSAREKRAERANRKKIKSLEKEIASLKREAIEREGTYGGH